MTQVSGTGGVAYRWWRFGFRLNDPDQGAGKAVNRVGFPFALVDVFADRPLTGNPLAVVWDADDLAADTMRRIAGEFNQSETTFVVSPTNQDADHRLRSFTPTGAEVTGAGHNALGAWWLLATIGRVELTGTTTTCYQQLGDRTLPLYIDVTAGRPTAVRMTQAPPEFHNILDDVADLAAALGLEPADIRTDLPSQVISTGAAHLMTAAHDQDAVDRADPDAPRLRRVLEQAGAQGCYLFSVNPADSDASAYARFFNPTVGIWEDPATGSAAGPLACHLAANRTVANGSTVLVEQGRRMGRRSRIAVRTAEGLVQISGTATTVAEGRLRV